MDSIEPNSIKPNSIKPDSNSNYNLCLGIDFGTTNSCLSIWYNNKAILITDIDMIPMNSTYYTKNIENINNDKFIYYRDVLM